MKYALFVYMTRNTPLLLILLFATFMVSCKNGDPFQKITKIFVDSDARAQYEHSFEGNDNELILWQKAFQDGIQNSVEIETPYAESGIFNPNVNLAYSYIFDIKEGEKLDVLVQKDSSQQKVFLNIFSLENASSDKYGLVGTQMDKLSFVSPNSGKYLLLIQPGNKISGQFSFIINKNPVYGFPVAGKSNDAIGSFWGMDRDGGKRKHEGIDIFAKKGTPVLAVSNGRITRTGNTGLGGKQVWQRTEIFGNSIYYAHLDSISVSSGSYAKQGDTLGFVGNTGNAQFTPPHLHLGIYKGFSGAIDPLPFVFERKKIDVHKKIRLDFKTDFVIINNKKVNLRKMPSTKSEIVTTSNFSEKLVLLGQNDDWVHIQTSEGLKGFVHKSLVKQSI
ncbi:peptidoglycan DD-metalloendopeptidase family protein [Flavobacterium sp. NST-5]|uniref:Peptidoglycan DD-metalloendopeptidase family protein n=1 Tax=Flavobacterium ichthyis TaxID=2698827 RepID=A0ABW9Z6Z4_9FLAO|nr:M23 family metallopeptidase [Flavobacterium ichthyis]NBL63986.1 peptidoglycan DD-metalloendopeptidase family protein [Flavobacterium ichthyis]